MADINNDAASKKEQETKPISEESKSEDNANSDSVKAEENSNEITDSKEKKSEKTKDEEKEEEDDGDDDDEESGEEEELPPGLLEQPLEVQGKREKKKVDRLSAAMVQPAEKKKVEIEEGKGVKLGEIDFIEAKLNSTLAVDLKPLHRLLFLRIGSANEVKRNIRQFCGFTHSKESKDHERRVSMLNKMHMPELKSICLTLALERSGSKKDVVDRIMDFLMRPDNKGKKAPQKKVKRRSKSTDGKKDAKKGTKRKRTSKKTKTKKTADDEGEVEEDDNDDEAGSIDEEEEKEDDIADEDISEEEIEEEESEEEAPKKKKAKVEPKKKVSANVNGKKEKSPPKPKKEKKKPMPKKKKDEIDDSLSEDSDSDDEPIAKMIKSPPSNEEIKKLIKNILEGADLESVTMKTVVKEVYGKYPTFDLSDRKDFIKSAVREIIS